MGKEPEEQKRSLLGIGLTERPKWQQFLICSSGFFFGYLVNGICEVIYLPPLKFLEGFSLSASPKSSFSSSRISSCRLSNWVFL